MLRVFKYILNFHKYTFSFLLLLVCWQYIMITFTVSDCCMPIIPCWKSSWPRFCPVPQCVFLFCCFLCYTETFWIYTIPFVDSYFYWCFPFLPSPKFNLGDSSVEKIFLSFSPSFLLFFLCLIILYQCVLMDIYFILLVTLCYHYLFFAHIFFSFLGHEWFYCLSPFHLFHYFSKIVFYHFLEDTKVSCFLLSVFFYWR